MQRLAQIGFGKLGVLATIASVLIGLAVFGQDMFSPGALSEQQPRKAPRGGISSHADIASCSACHAPAWSSDTMASRCMACHDNIQKQLDGNKAMHGLFAQGSDCFSCHTEHKGPHGALTNFAHFDHACTAFKLTGKHRQANCAACHHDKPFQGTPQACVACHVEPSAHTGKFGLECASCHATENWKTSLKSELFTSVKFDHAACTGFALTGRHAKADCMACHKDGKGGAFKGLSQACVSCHAEPTTHKDKFGVACASCHGTTDWKSVTFNKELFAGAGFDHDTTAFKLTGKHVTADCKSCHTGNTFKGTPTSCVSCHSEPASHKPHPKSFGTNCAQCHSTSNWKKATLVQSVHRFPIGHGNKKNKSADNACSLCHPKALTLVSTVPTPDYSSYTCYGCHHHSEEKEIKRHAGRKVAVLNKCAACHRGEPAKKGKAGRPKDTVAAPLDLTCFSESEASGCAGELLSGLCPADLRTSVADSAQHRAGHRDDFVLPPVQITQELQRLTSLDPRIVFSLTRRPAR